MYEGWLRTIGVMRCILQEMVYGDLCVMQNIFITIDSSSTRDIDDALAVDLIPGGGFRVFVAIANPTRLVKIGSQEDDRARRLGATAYVRDLAVSKMLPSRISEDEGSLVEGKARNVLLFEIEIGADLTVTKFSPALTQIVISNRLNYDQIPLIVADPDHELHAKLTAATRLAKLLLHNRRQHGALALYDLSRLLLTDEEGNIHHFNSVDEVIGNILIQEMMILTNSLVGQYMVKHNIPAIFRNHQPKLAAPRSDELARTIESWIVSGMAETEIVHSQFNAIAGKAKYGAIAIGHYGLSLPIYLHATSPLRRYADLVNLRQMVAHLSGKDSHYKPDELQKISEDLNESTERRQEERSSGFKAVVARTASRAVASGDLSKLADHELSAAVKLAPDVGYLPPVLILELISRMEKATLADTVVDRLIFEVPRKLVTSPLAISIGSWLQENPARAMHLLQHGSNIGLFSEISTTFSQNDASFVATTLAKISETGQDFNVTGVGGRKRDAEQAAAVRLISEIFDFPLSQDKEKPIVQRKEKADYGNPKGKLLELCQKQYWPTPNFEVKGCGPSNKMVFSANVTLIVDGIQYEGQSKGELTKKDAEAVSAKHLLSQVEHLVRGVKKAEISLSNPVSALQEYAQKIKSPMPEYQYVQETGSLPLFNCTVTTSFHGRQRSFSAKAGNKQEAKRLAAESAIGALKISK